MGIWHEIKGEVVISQQAKFSVKTFLEVCFGRIETVYSQTQKTSQNKILLDFTLSIDDAISPKEIMDIINLFKNRLKEVDKTSRLDMTVSFRIVS